MIEITTIGFTKKNASKFFSLLKSEGVKTIIDTRIIIPRNYQVSQKVKI